MRRLYKLGQRNVATVALVSLGLGAVLAVIATISFFNERDIESQITREVRRVESPCLQHGPHSSQCHRSFGTALEALNEVLTPEEARIIVCRSHIFDQLKACRKVRQIEAALKESEDREGQDEQQLATVNGGDAESTGNPGSSQPGPHGGGGGHESKVAPGGGGHKEPPEKLPPPAGDESAAPPTTTSSSTTTTTERTSESSVVEAAPPAPVRESVGGVVSEVGETVTGTVESVTEPVCTLTELLCPK